MHKNAFILDINQFYVFVFCFVTLNKLLRLSIKNKRVYFVLRSTFRNFDCVEVNRHSEKLKYIWLFSHFFVTLDKLLRLSIKNKRVYFVRSTFRNFAGQCEYL